MYSKYYFCTAFYEVISYVLV